MKSGTRRQFVRRTIALGALGSTAPVTWAKANDYPTRPVICLVGFGAGGSVDIVARTVGEKLTARMGQTFVIENRPGAGGNIAATVAAKAPPNGYTLFVASSANAVSPYLYQSLQYDPQKDFAYISRWITTSYMVVTSSSFPARSFRELVEMAKNKPEGITLGTQGIGTPPNIAAELLSRNAGIRVLQVPFKGGPETMLAVLAGTVDFTFAPIPVAMPHVQSGTARLLALTSAIRSPIYPDTPTVAEQGFPGFEVSAWYGLVAPKGTPSSIVNALSDQSEAVLALPDVREKLAAQGMEPAFLGPAAMTSYFSEQLKFYAQLTVNAK
jgi:tripartite-type tricarboxylate transporter receptor subunit TctC